MRSLLSLMMVAIPLTVGCGDGDKSDDTATDTLDADGGTDDGGTDDTGTDDTGTDDTGTDDTGTDDTGTDDTGTDDTGTDDTGTDDTGTAPVDVTIDCDAVTKIVHEWGGSTGPCGPVTTVEIDTAGNVSRSHTDAEPPDGSAECETVTTSDTIEDPAALFALVCNDFNDGFDPIEDCDDGGWESIALFAGDDLLIGSGGCIPPGLVDAQTALYEALGS